MKRLKLLALATVASAAALSSQAFATPTVDGLTFPFGGQFIISSIYENPVTTPGDTLSGFGMIDLSQSSPSCVGGAGSCELTFVFDDFVVKDITASTIDFTGGTVDFYVDTTPDFNGKTGGSRDNAKNGSLFLHTTGHSYLDTSSGRTGTLLGGGTNLNTDQPLGQGLGLLDVAGGDAAAYFNSDTYSDFLGGFADLQFTSSFHTSTNGSTCPDNGESICGSGSLDAVVVAVPEPGTLGLMGLGLIVMGFCTRRLRRKS